MAIAVLGYTGPESGQVGESLALEDGVRANMKVFVLSQVYSESADITCGQARASKPKSQKLKKKSTVRLSPDDDSLNHHVVRINYITIASSIMTC